MTLYVRQGCGYCMSVLDAARRMGIRFSEVKDIADPAVALEVAERGGKWQVPYLIDEGAGVSLYESDAIIRYLQDKRAAATA